MAATVAPRFTEGQVVKLHGMMVTVTEANWISRNAEGRIIPGRWTYVAVTESGSYLNIR